MDFPFFVWLLDQYWKVLNQPSERLTSPDVFPLFGKPIFLAYPMIVLFYNKYFVTLGFGLLVYQT